MIDQRPLKVGQSVIHDVKGRGYYTKECAASQKMNTSMVCIFVDFNTGGGPENVSRSCCHLDRVNPPEEYLENIAQTDAREDLIDAGLMTGSPDTHKVLVNVCPDCGAEEYIDIDSTLNTMVDHELCCSN